MAMRAVDDHPKLHNLKTILDCGRGEALGYLEALWHFAGRFAPAGNIGRYSDVAIESWIEWKGEPGALIRALTESDWLDKSDAHRLVIHDWHDHADDATDNQLARAMQLYADGTMPRMRRLAQKERAQLIEEFKKRGHVVSKPCASVRTSAHGVDIDAHSKPLPEPEPEPEPVPVLFDNSAETSSAPPAAYLPLVTGAEFPISAERLQEWEKAFPGVDVEGQIKRMRVWLDANPSRRVTARGVLKFAVSWLSREQDSGAHRRVSNAGISGGNGANRNQQRTNGNLDALRRAEAEIDAKVIGWPGGSAASERKRGDVEAVLIPTQ